MSEVLEICICINSGSKMDQISQIEVVKRKGIINDRYFSENSEKDTQITLIESENIDYFNEKCKTNIPYIDFRRNIITKGIKLNEIVVHEGVKILGYGNMPGRVAKDASALYSKNIFNFLSLLIDKKKNEINFNWDDEIISSVFLSFDGKIRLEQFY